MNNQHDQCIVVTWALLEIIVRLNCFAHIKENAGARREREGYIFITP